MRPKQASLRRAVSTAYYALFHLLGIELAKNWKRVEERSTIARMLDHGPMARVCAAKRAELNKYFATRPVASRQVSVLRHIQAIANTFEQMHQQRQIADYGRSGENRVCSGRLRQLERSPGRTRSTKVYCDPPAEERRY